MATTFELPIEQLLEIITAHEELKGIKFYREDADGITVWIVGRENFVLTSTIRMEPNELARSSWVQKHLGSNSVKVDRLVTPESRVVLSVGLGS